MMDAEESIFFAAFPGLFLFIQRQSRCGWELSISKGIFGVLTPKQVFYEKSSDTLRALRISHKKLAWANTYLFSLMNSSHPHRLRHGIKKKVIDHEKQRKK